LLRHGIKTGRKQKLKLKIGNALVNKTMSICFLILIHMRTTSCIWKQSARRVAFGATVYTRSLAYKSICMYLKTVCQEGSILGYRIYSHISQSAYKSLDVKKRPKFDTRISLRVAGDDVRTGHMAVAERPAACRWRRDAAAATSDDAVAAGTRWVVHGQWWWHDTAGEERRSLPVGTSTADSASSAVTVIDPLCRRLASISRRL